MLQNQQYLVEIIYHEIQKHKFLFLIQKIGTNLLIFNPTINFFAIKDKSANV